MGIESMVMVRRRVFETSGELRAIRAKVVVCRACVVSEEMVVWVIRAHTLHSLLPSSPLHPLASLGRTFSAARPVRVPGSHHYLTLLRTTAE